MEGVYSFPSQYKLAEFTHFKRGPDVLFGPPWIGASLVALVVKNPPANAGDIRDPCSIPESGRFPGGGHGKPLQCSCLENPMDRGAWRAVVHRVAKRHD